MNKVRKFGKNVVAAIVLGTISFLGFFLYMVVVGIPKTQARYYYNLAEETLESAESDLDIIEAKDYLELALEFWPEGYIQEKLDSIK